MEFPIPNKRRKLGLSLVARSPPFLFAINSTKSKTKSMIKLGKTISSSTKNLNCLANELNKKSEYNFNYPSEAFDTGLKIGGITISQVNASLITGLAFLFLMIYFTFSIQLSPLINVSVIFGVAIITIALLLSLH